MAQLLRRTLGTPGLAIWLPALVAILLASIPTIVHGPPAPIIEDELGYLLSAETFAGGRATNETHPLWRQFEAIHQFHEPSYQSKYPPGQALSLALGEKLGHPIVGVWLGIGLMIASIVWMLLAWFPRGWAFLGGWLALLQFVMIGLPFREGTFAYWSQSYWGGALAAAGGALLFGGVARCLKKPQVAPALAIAGGLLLLANTRPLEGLLASLVPCGYLVFKLATQRGDAMRGAFKRMVLPASLVLLAGFAAMGWYNHQVSGKVSEMPWKTHYEQYCIFPVFLWEDLVPDRDWQHEDLRVFYGEVERRMFTRHQNLKGLLVHTVGKLGSFAKFYFGVVFALVFFLALPRLLRDRLSWWLVTPILIVVISGLLKFNSPPHYSAPIAGLVIALLVQSLRVWAGWRPGKSFGGPQLVGLVLVLGTGIFAWGTTKAIANAAETRNGDRFQALQQLEAVPGEHLVLVSYGPENMNGDVWLFNEANIDAARIVWARDSSPEARRALLEYYPDRTVWTLRTGFGQAHPRPELLER